MYKMKTKSLSLIMSLILSLSIIFSVNVSYVEVVDAKVVSNLNTYTGTYYNSLGGLNSLISGKYSSKEVFEGLRALIGYASSGQFSSSSSDKYISAFGKTINGTDKKHPKYGGTSSGSLAYLWQTSDRLVNDSHPTGTCRLFYSNIYTSSIKDFSSVTVNREHVWPQSLSGGLFGTTGAGADAHHVRPANASLNGARSNKPYADLSSNEITTTYYTTGTSASSFNKIGKYLSEDSIKSNYKGELTGYATSSKFEPTDQYKGDVARIFAYLITHYPSLESLLNNVLVGGTKTLVAWNKLDPVDSYEIQQNNIIADFQGNRNPYIDEPQLINVIWGNGVDPESPDPVIPDPEDPVNPDPEDPANPDPEEPQEENTYTLVTSASQITVGSEIVIVGNYGNNNYAITENNSGSSNLSSTSVTVKDNAITTDDAAIVWKVGASGSGLTLQSKENSKEYISYTSSSSTKISISTKPSVFKVGTYSKKDGIYLMSTSNRGLLYNNSIKGFKNYSLTNIGANGYASKMSVYIKTK